MTFSSIRSSVRSIALSLFCRNVGQQPYLRAPYCTTTRSSQVTGDREFLSSFKPEGGHVSLNKNANTGIATVVMDDPRAHNALSDPLLSEDYFNLKTLFTKQQLFDARVHMGHKAGVRNPYMVPYLFGNRLGCDIIDIEQTEEHLHKALNFMAHIAYREGIILFLTRHRESLLVVEELANDCKEYSQCRFWRGGTFTNAPVMFNATTRLPDLCIFLSTHNTIFEQHVAVVEASKMNIPTVGIVDSSSDPRLISYPIPGNDDSFPAIKLYCSLFKQTILIAKERREKDRILRLEGR